MSKTITNNIAKSPSARRLRKLLRQGDLKWTQRTFEAAYRFPCVRSGCNNPIDKDELRASGLCLTCRWSRDSNAVIDCGAGVQIRPVTVTEGASP